MLVAGTQITRGWRKDKGLGVRQLGDFPHLCFPSCLSCPPPPPTTDMSLELEQLREERNRLDTELQLSAHIIQQEVGRAREQGTPGACKSASTSWGPESRGLREEEEEGRAGV